MKTALKNMDYLLLFATLIIALFGLVMIFSASSITSVLLYNKPEYYFFRKELLVFAGAVIVFIITTLLPLETYRHFKIYLLLMIGAIGVLIALKSYGSITNSAQSWFRISGIGFQVQPSEFAKSITILYLATAYGRRKKFIGKMDPFIPLIPCIVIFFLIAIEPDYGTAFIYTMIVASVFFSIPFGKNNWISITKGLFIVGVVGAILFMYNASSLLSDNQRSRFQFERPCDRYKEESGYQVCNGYIAMNNGGLFGVGLGKSTQKYLYLPAAHTDFIFPIIVEEWGLAGGAFVILLYMFILYRILAIAKHAANLQGSMIAFGTFALLIIHIFINLGGVLAIIPLTGVPLPFLSYGGSIGLNLGILIGLTERVAIESKITKKKELAKA